MNDKVIAIGVCVVIGTLASNLLITNAIMLAGLFDTRVNNADVFKIIGPSYQQITGAFTGFFGGLAVGKMWSKD